MAEGYWRESNESDIIIECINAPKNCLKGEGNDTCLEGFTGPLCENCDFKNGYTESSKYECRLCSQNGWNVT